MSLNRIQIRKRVEAFTTLPGLPAVLARLGEVFENPSLSLREIADFLAADQSLTSRLLRVANSAAYGFMRRINSPTQALLLLGLNNAKSLLLQLALIDTMERTIGGLWRHSLGCACAARAIVTAKAMFSQEDLSIPALLHDFGKVPLALILREHYTKVLAFAKEKNMPLFQAEKEQLDVTHAEVGAWLAERWNLPGMLVEAIRFHHAPHRAKNFPLETALVHVADALTISAALGFSGSSVAPLVTETALAAVGLDGDGSGEIVTQTVTLLLDAERALGTEEEPYGGSGQTGQRGSATSGVEREPPRDPEGGA